MSQIRAIRVPGGIAIEGPDEDAEYRDLVAREEPPRIEPEPPLTRCPNPKCWNEKAEATAVCSVCKTNKLTGATPLCPYVKGKTCDCGLLAACLEIA